MWMELIQTFKIKNSEFIESTKKSLEIFPELHGPIIIFTVKAIFICSLIKTEHIQKKERGNAYRTTNNYISEIWIQPDCHSIQQKIFC